MRTILRFTILSLVCLTYKFAAAQSLPGYWTNLQQGKFTVGFKSLCVFDTSRNYDLTCGDSPVILNSKNAGRPILLNVWYPAKHTKDTSVLEVKDYFNFPANENTKFFFAKLKAYQFKNSKLYSTDENMGEENFDGDSSSYERAKVAAFENYISSNTLSHKDVKPEDGEFPIIIYQQGLGGTIDENSLLLEYLASNGYIVINSAFQEADGSGYIHGWEVGVGDQRASFDDIYFIINYCRQHNISKSKKIFLMGHSYGANSSISFLGQGYKNVDGIIPLDSDFGYELYSSYPPEFNPFIKAKLKFFNVPFFCVGRSEAHFRMIDSLSLSKRFYLTISGMKHSDFTSQRAIGRFYSLPFIKEKQRYKQVTLNYLNMCAAVLQFLNGYTKTGEGLKKMDVPLYKGWQFDMSNPGKKLPYNRPYDESTGKCPTISQFLDLIYFAGLKKSEQIYTQCTDTTFKQSKTLLDIFEALYWCSKEDTLIEYLNWMNEEKVAKNNLKDIFDIVSSASLSDYGNGFHYDKADSIYKWMIEKFSANKYGYMGRLLVSKFTGNGDMRLYCKKILEIEPDFENIKTHTYIERMVKDTMLKYFKKE